MTRIFACLVALAVATSTSAATLEVPANGGSASGIGYISGWKCPPNDNLTAVIDGGVPIPLSSGVRRGDTAAACGNDGRNGYIAQINFGNLGDGPHSVSIRRNGVPFAGGSFSVTTFGTSFLTGASGQYTLPNFPSAGKTATVQWSEGAQNFVIIGKSTGPNPGPTAAQVRYGNDLTCFGSFFESTLSANGFHWLSFTGVFSPYQSVNRSTLGPLQTTNDPRCGNITYPGIFNLTPGRRYSFVQRLVGSNPVLTQNDEGAVPSTEADTSSPAERTEIVTVIGSVSEGSEGIGMAP